MGLSTYAKNLNLDYIATVALYASIHTADPGDNGANEVVGGSPAYARLPVTWNPAAGGTLTISNQPEFDLPAGTFTHIGLWDSVSGGNYIGSGDVIDFTLSGQGKFVIINYQLTQ